MPNCKLRAHSSLLMWIESFIREWARFWAGLNLPSWFFTPFPAKQEDQQQQQERLNVVYDGNNKTTFILSSPN